MLVLQNEQQGIHHSERGGGRPTYCIKDKTTREHTHQATEELLQNKAPGKSTICYRDTHRLRHGAKDLETEPSIVHQQHGATIWTTKQQAYKATSGPKYQVKQRHVSC